MGIWGLWNKVVTTVRGVNAVTRRPATARAALLNLVMWSVALLFAMVSIASFIVLQSWGTPMLYVVILLGILDTYMLVLAIKGLRFRRRVDACVEKLIAASSNA